MNTVLNTCRIFVLLLFTSVMSTAIADKPDFSLCDGLMGAAKGLCHAGIAVGCDQEASNACEQIEEQYTAKTGNEPPWVDRSIYVRSEETQVCDDPTRRCAVPLDGTWTFGCETSDDPGEPGDSEELLIFMGDTFEAQEIEYASSGGECDGVEAIESLTGTVAAFDDVMKLGWIDEEGNWSLAPLRRDGSGAPLTNSPYVTHLEFRYYEEGEEVVERTFLLIDDTAEPWYFYREDGQDDTMWGDYLRAFEPLSKI